MADKERSYEGAVLPSPTSGPAFASELPLDPLATPPRLAGAVASPSPPAPPHPSAGRAVRRLGLGIEPNALAPSCPRSPDVICSQLRLQEYEEWPQGTGADGPVPIAFVDAQGTGADCVRRHRPLYGRKARLLRGVRRARFAVDAPHGPRAEKPGSSAMDD